MRLPAPAVTVNAAGVIVIGPTAATTETVSLALPEQVAALPAAFATDSVYMFEAAVGETEMGTPEPTVTLFTPQPLPVQVTVPVPPENVGTSWVERPEVIVVAATAKPVHDAAGTTLRMIVADEFTPVTGLVTVSV